MHDGGEKKELTQKQKLFCFEYVKTGNGTRAAAAIGNRKNSSAEAWAVKQLKLPEIQAEIKRLNESKEAQVLMDTAYVLRKLKDLAEVDIKQAFDQYCCLLPVSEMPASVRACISSIEVFEQYQGSGKNRVYIGRVQKIRFWDKLKALELIGKHLKMFTDKVELEDPEGRHLAESNEKLVTILQSLASRARQEPMVIDARRPNQLSS